MNRNRKLLLTSLVLGLMSLAMAILGGMHLQHLVNDGGGRHLGEAVILIVLALGLLAGSVWACQRERKAG
jgi:predicted membrane-bound spermidine synthase